MGLTAAMSFSWAAVDKYLISSIANKACLHFNTDDTGMLFE
jgi:hypothetical protein